MLQNAFIIILIVTVALVLSLSLKKYYPYRYGAGESAQMNSSQPGMFSDPYENASLLDLNEELNILCEESKFEELGSLVKAIKDRADLVIVGRIESSSSKHKYSGASDEEARFYFSISVESVERGSCPYDTIQAYVGYYANWSASGFYPSWVKTNYKNGDRARIFINYFPGEPDPIVTAGFFGMEPLSP